MTSAGSADFDNRSLGLNFESNATVYDKDFAHKVKAAYLYDIEHWYTELAMEEYNKRSRPVRLTQDVSRLCGSFRLKI